VVVSPSVLTFIGYRQKEWYVAQQARSEVTVLDGPLRTLREARHRVFVRAREAGDPNPWPQQESFAYDGYPSFYAMHTAADVYFVGLGGALFDQGDAWADALRSYENEQTP
jgi:hypothetical protein